MFSGCQFISTGSQISAFFFPDFNIIFNNISLPLVYTWAHITRYIKAIADFKFLNSFD